jgi:hypothetical protein
MRRREFITVLSGTAVAWPLVARAQLAERRIAVFPLGAQSDPETQTYARALRESLAPAISQIDRNPKMAPSEHDPEPDFVIKYGLRRCHRLRK